MIRFKVFVFAIMLVAACSSSDKKQENAQQQEDSPKSESPSVSGNAESPDLVGVDGGGKNLTSPVPSPTPVPEVKHRSPSSISSDDDFFVWDGIYLVEISDWPAKLKNSDWIKSEKAFLRIYGIDPDEGSPCPKSNKGENPPIFETAGKNFDLKTEESKSKTPVKLNYQVRLKNNVAAFSIKALKLKAMGSDVSQMREAIAWKMIEAAKTVAPRQAYARLCMNGKYLGLYSIIEDVNPSFLLDRFKNNGSGNLYKGNWENQDMGPATLAYRKSDVKDPQGKTIKIDNSGNQYFKVGIKFKDRTYSLSTNDTPNRAGYQTYADLATFIRVINGRGPFVGKEEKVEFNSEAYKKQVESIFDVKSFLRWAAVNSLVGGFENYWAIPSNYYLYNGGQKDKAKFFFTTPYFTWIPWDYEKSFGLDPSGTDWQSANIIDWPEATKTYYKNKGSSYLPLVTNLLQNDEFKTYYIDYMEYFLENFFKVSWVDQVIEDIWPKISRSVFLEADGPQEKPFTGRPFTNDEVYWQGYKQQPGKDGPKSVGLWQFVNTRHDIATKQITSLRSKHPRTTLKFE